MRNAIYYDSLSEEEFKACVWVELFEIAMSELIREDSFGEIRHYMDSHLHVMFPIFATEMMLTGPLYEESDGKCKAIIVSRRGNDNSFLGYWPNLNEQNGAELLDRYTDKKKILSAAKVAAEKTGFIR